MENKIKMFIGCNVPAYTCNFKCMYCYLGQHPETYEKGIIQLFASPEEIAHKFDINRIGGPCYFNMCGAGETLLHPQIIDLVIALTSNGHYTDIITNGSLSNRFDELIKKTSEESKKHILIKFSFHYIQLKEKGLLDTFVSNVNKIKDSGISYSIEITPHDELIPYIDELKEFSFSRFGALPHITVGRKANTSEIDILTEQSRSDYEKTWGTFESDMFKFKMSTFNEKRCEFCYAGVWSIQLDLKSGDYFQCYAGDYLGSLVKEDTIHKRAVGKCRVAHCFNGHAYLTFGIIPELDTPSYASMRNRVSECSEWLQDDMKEFCTSKLNELNNEYDYRNKIKILRTNIAFSILSTARNYERKIARRIRSMKGKNNRKTL